MPTEIGFETSPRRTVCSQRHQIWDDVLGAVISLGVLDNHDVHVCYPAWGGRSTAQHIVIERQKETCLG